MCLGWGDWGAALAEERYVWLVLALLVLPLAGFILMNTWIYNGWRHVYFLLIPLLIIAGHGLEHLTLLRFRHSRLPQVVAVLTLVGSLAWQAGWIITRHPHQYVYFNAVGRPIADQFDRDYWRLTQTELYHWILEDAQQGSITVYDRYLNHPQMLEPAEQARLVLLDAQPLEELDPPPDYILESYYNVAGNAISHPGYSEVYATWVDGFKIASVFKRN